MFSARTRWPLTPNELTRACEERRRASQEILDLTESNPTRCGFDYDEARVLNALQDSRILQYEPDPRGLLSARQAIADCYLDNGIEIFPSQIFLTASTSEAYSFIFRLIGNAGDQLLVPQPSYPLFEFLGRLDDLELAHYPLIEEDGWRISRGALQSQISRGTRAILVVNPNNPTGSFVQREDRGFLIRCCAERQLALIADEVFHDYWLEDDREQASFAGERCALVFTLNGLSKISALPQMKCAWIVLSGPADLVQEASARLEVIADTYLSTSTPVAVALPALLSLRRELQPQIVTRIRANLATVDRIIGPGSLLSRLPVQGGWYAVLRVPSWQSDETWTVRLVERDGVLVHPGHFYDFQDEGRIIVSLICRPEVFEQGIARLIGRVETDCRSAGWGG
jgi:alanine-synthesizing transaminase